MPYKDRAAKNAAARRRRAALSGEARESFRARDRAAHKKPSYRAAARARDRAPKRRAYMQAYMRPRRPAYRATERRKRNEFRQFVEAHGGAKELRRFGQTFFEAVSDLLGGELKVGGRAPRKGRQPRRKR